MATAIKINDPETDMLKLLARQRATFEAERPVSADARLNRLSRALDLLLTHSQPLVDAMSEDYGHRSKEMSLMTDLMASVKPIKHAMKNLERWMKP